ncbi:8192_t:CDS:2 [Paraglomus occultum]|uniref:8192_t:CDS:1 n=1 Tax=Paraglomus occultum TaxID=144539 RepID=A0A9N9G9W8_9GLOM|nr:8192_t:CDS:2 [Paraglomus occultum]
MSSSKQTKMPTKSYAAAAKKATPQSSPFSFQNTECNLDYDVAISNRQVPNTDLKNSVFFDLRNLPVSEQDLFDYLKSRITGIALREDLGLLEAAFADEKTADNFLKTPLLINEKRVAALPPRNKAPRILRIKLANVPLLPRPQVENALTTHWGQYASVKAIAPFTYKGTSITTRRWDMIVEITPEADRLEAPVAFPLLGSTIIANWRGAPPSCLSCKSAGHYSSKCPKHLPKNQPKVQIANPPKPQAKQSETTAPEIQSNTATPTVHATNNSLQGSVHNPANHPNLVHVSTPTTVASSSKTTITEPCITILATHWPRMMQWAQMMKQWPSSTTHSTEM